MPIYPRDPKQKALMQKDRAVKSTDVRQAEALEQIADALDDLRGVFIGQENLLKDIRDVLAKEK